MQASGAETKEGLVITSGQASGNCDCCQDRHHLSRGVYGGGGVGGVQRGFTVCEGGSGESESTEWSGLVVPLDMGEWGLGIKKNGVEGHRPSSFCFLIIACMYLSHH